ncbi:MAG: acetamidase [Ruminococcaceae bacterium]|nr:acetamidase [Oscillospiraceae bacterium]
MFFTQSVYEFDPAHHAIAKIPSGTLITMQTQDCFGGQVKAGQKVNELNLSHTNPAVGPIYVISAEPGDAVRADILDIIPLGPGVTCTVPACGPLCNTCEPRTIFLENREGFVDFQGLRFFTDPMVGVIGCTPIQPVPTGWVGDHGGNMDCKHIRKGASVYCPVFLEGGLFLLGDVHAVMGDGELCGTGLEVPALVTLRLTVIKQVNLRLPVLETPDKWYVIGHGKTYPEALQLTTQVMQELLMQQYGLDAADAFLYLSLQGDVEVCQSCIPCSIDMVLRCGVPKQIGKPLIGTLHENRPR